MAEGAPANWREFGYIRDSGPRVTEYEAVCCYVQPSMRFDGSLTYSGFPDGRGTWVEESTALQHTDWFAFRDPAQMWNRPYITRQNEQERAIEQLTRYHLDTGTMAQMDPDWARYGLGMLYLPSAHLEYSMFRACSYSHREALSDTVAVAFAFNAFDKMRHAENLIFYGQDLAEAGLDLGTDPAKDHWLSLPELQGARRVAERLLACRDWGEIAVITNLVIEPLLGSFIADQVLLPGAARAGDYVTPILVAEAGRDRQRNRAWSEAFVRFVLDDDKHGADNLATLEGWLADWSVEVLQAMRTLSPAAEHADRVAGAAADMTEAAWLDLLDNARIRTAVLR